MANVKTPTTQLYRVIFSMYDGEECIVRSVRASSIEDAAEKAMKEEGNDLGQDPQVRIFIVLEEHLTVMEYRAETIVNLTILPKAHPPKVKKGSTNPKLYNRKMRRT